MRVININTSVRQAFSGIIYFSTHARPSDIKPNLEKNEPVPENKPVPDDALAIYNKAKEILPMAKPALSKHDDIYSYAKESIANSIEYYKNICPSSYGTSLKGILSETDDDGILKKETFFNRDGDIKLIKDYENNRIIGFNKLPPMGLNPSICLRKSLQGEEFTVFLDCKDIKNPNTIKAKESFSFLSGYLRRYTASCEADTQSDRFISDNAYIFKRNLLTGINLKYTVSAGTEYSNEFFLFDPGYSSDSFEALKNLSLVKYVKNKISTNGIICYSTNELDLSGYKFSFN